MSDSSDVLIIGAGLAGLSAAITLQAAGRNVRVIESSDRPGGRVTSDLIDGFVCDRGAWMKSISLMTSRSISAGYFELIS